MKKLAIFDFDGTLFDTVEDVETCLNEALSLNGFETLSSDEIIKRLGGNVNEIVSLVLKDKNTPENISMVRTTYDELYSSSDLENSRLFPDIPEVLKKLSEMGVKLSINSNRTSDSIRFFLDRSVNDIDFLTVQGYEEGHPSKPDPYGVNRILERIEVSKEDVLYIGDSLTDVKTCENAGIDCLIVEWGYGDETDFENEHVLSIVENAAEILDYFRRDI